MQPPIPLFFYALCFLLGVATKLVFHPFYLPILFLIWLLGKRSTVCFVIFLAGIVYASISVTFPTLPDEGVEGHGIFKPESISYGHSPFGISFITKGTLETFTTHHQTWKKVPCQIYTPLNKTRPSGQHTLLIKGRLLPKTFPHYVLKPAQLDQDLSTFSLAEYRFQIKDWIRHHFFSLFSQKEVASFLLSMITGDIDDRLLALQFNRLGLLHLLGVSGFQFSLLAAFLGVVLRKIFSNVKGIYVLIILLSAYAFILGNSPPIQRAYVSVILYAIARLANLQISPLNALGAALVWQLILDPCVLFQLGFQFSFLCTAAIFIIYPFLQNLSKRLFPDRSFSHIRRLPILDRWGHTLVFFCREALMLNLAIHLASLPLIFYHFHKLPLLSLVYNLFLPPLVSVAYLFLIPGLILYPLSHLMAFPFLKGAEFLTQMTLLVATHPPALFDFQWRIPGFGMSLALLLLSILLASLIQNMKRQKDRVV